MQDNFPFFPKPNVGQVCGLIYPNKGFEARVEFVFRVWVEWKKRVNLEFRGGLGLMVNAG